MYSESRKKFNQHRRQIQAQTKRFEVLEEQLEYEEERLQYLKNEMQLAEFERARWDGAAPAVVWAGIIGDKEREVQKAQGILDVAIAEYKRFELRVIQSRTKVQEAERLISNLQAELPALEAAIEDVDVIESMMIEFDQVGLSSATFEKAAFGKSEFEQIPFSPIDTSTTAESEMNFISEFSSIDTSFTAEPDTEFESEFSSLDTSFSAEPDTEFESEFSSLDTSFSAEPDTEFESEFSSIDTDSGDIDSVTAIDFGSDITAVQGKKAAFKENAPVQIKRPPRQTRKQPRRKAPVSDQELLARIRTIPQEVEKAVAEQEQVIQQTVRRITPTKERAARQIKEVQEADTAGEQIALATERLQEISNELNALSTTAVMKFSLRQTLLKGNPKIAETNNDLLHVADMVDQQIYKAAPKMFPFLVNSMIGDKIVLIQAARRARKINSLMSDLQEVLLVLAENDQTASKMPTWLVEFAGYDFPTFEMGKASVVRTDIPILMNLSAEIAKARNELLMADGYIKHLKRVN